MLGWSSRLVTRFPWPPSCYGRLCRGYGGQFQVIAPLRSRSYSQGHTNNPSSKGRVTIQSAVDRKIQDIASTLGELSTSEPVRPDVEQASSRADGLEAELRQVRELAALSATDDELRADLLVELDRLQAVCDDALVKRWLSGPYDMNSAYLDIHAGSGGTDACDWASMLVRMYTKWAYSQSYTVDTVSETPGDVTGVKATTLFIQGQHAYGYAQYETGVHRLVRMSPFDPKGARHTSFASVRVSPHFDTQDWQEMEIKLYDADLKISTMRSQGPGGQHVNKTESAVRVEHIPTGITVTCQQERQQSANRKLAMQLLRSKLYEIELRKKEQTKTDAHNQLPEISWGSQIRSYVLHPYRLVKDSRSGYQVVGNKQVDAILDGEITDFMIESLQHFKRSQ